jgi:hypothetical protein
MAVLSPVSSLNEGRDLESFLRNTFESTATLVSVLSQVTDPNSEIFSLKLQLRDFSRQVRGLCYKALRIIDEVSNFREICTPKRTERISKEIQASIEQGIELFNFLDLTNFPETIDFIDELLMRLGIVINLLKEFTRCCDLLLTDFKNAQIKAKDRYQPWKLSRVFQLTSYLGTLAMSPNEDYQFEEIAGNIMESQKKEYKAVKCTLEKEVEKLHRVLADEIEGTMGRQGCENALLSNVNASVNNIIKTLLQTDTSFAQQREKIRGLVECS